jgi:hypothetical protein
MAPPDTCLPAYHYRCRGLRSGTGGPSRVRGTASATSTARMMTGPGHAPLRQPRVASRLRG